MLHAGVPKFFPVNRGLATAVV